MPVKNTLQQTDKYYRLKIRN